VRDAEEHAAEDKKRREEAEVKNNGEQLVYSVEKVLSENADKLPEDVKTEVQADVDALKSALAGEDVETVKTAVEKLSQSQSKLGEALYAAESAAQQDGGDAPTDEASGSDEDIVDAEVVEDEEGESSEESK